MEIEKTKVYAGNGRSHLVSFFKKIECANIMCRKYVSINLRTVPIFSPGGNFFKKGGFLFEFV